MYAYLFAKDIAPHLKMELISEKTRDAPLEQPQIIFGTPNATIFRLAARIQNVSFIRCIIFDDCTQTAKYTQVQQLYQLPTPVKIFVDENVPEENLLQSILSSTNDFHSNMDISCTTDHFTIVMKKNKLTAVTAISHALKTSNEKAIFYCKVCIT